MNFHRYSSLENNYNVKQLQNIQVAKDVEWIATEKIHGVNFSATVNDDTIKWGKRTVFIDDDLKNFNNCHLIDKRYRENVFEVFKDIKKTYSHVSHIQIFGELCGGGYENYYFNCDTTLQKIQKQIQYSPNLEFIVFDIAVFHNESKVFLNLNNVILHCNTHLNTVGILHRGTLKEMLKLNPNFITTVPKRFGLPLIENNWAEGYVIRPFNEFSSKNGRLLTKIKGSKFSETCGKEIFLPDSMYTDEQKKMVSILSTFININRFDAVESKLNDTEKLNKHKIAGLILKDIHEEYEQLYPIELTSSDIAKINHDFKRKHDLTVFSMFYQTIIENIYKYEKMKKLQDHLKCRKSIQIHIMKEIVIQYDDYKSFQTLV